MMLLEIVLLILASTFFIAPIVYMFLRLTNQIGPDDVFLAIFLSVILWIVGSIGGWKFLAMAINVVTGKI